MNEVFKENMSSMKLTAVYVRELDKCKTEEEKEQLSRDHDEMVSKALRREIELGLKGAFIDG